MSLLVICGILALCLNTLAADEKYSLRCLENLPETNKMQLSKIRNTFEFVAAFLNSAFNFEHSEKKDDLHS